MQLYPMIPKAKYDNPSMEISRPERKKKKDSKTLVIMCTYIPYSLLSRYGSTRSSDNYRFSYLHNRLESLKFTLACYDKYNAGADYDLIIVDNDSPGGEGKEYLDSLDIPVYYRENTYYSFGAYKYGWDKFGDDYDYFVFHECDWVPAKDNWLVDLINYWNSDKDIGMIGNLIERRGWSPNPLAEGARVNNRFIEKINPKRLNQFNLDSEYLFTSKNVLKNMDKTGWQIYKCEPETKLSPVYNELAFQQPLLEMGYSIVSFNDGKHSMFYATYNRGFGDKWDNGLENLAPFVPEQTRLFCKKMKNYFKWYKGKTSLEHEER